MSIMRTIAILLLCIFTACNDVEYEKKDAPQALPVPPPVTAASLAADNNVKRFGKQYLDNAPYKIYRVYYPSGIKMSETYTDTLAMLDLYREFYENRQLKLEGTMTQNNHIYIGTWKYYSEQGKLDSAIDHDKKYKVSYWESLAIAGKKGYTMPGIEVDISIEPEDIFSEGKRTYWKFYRWSHTGTYRDTATTIRIDTETGKVSKTPFERAIKVY